jgi:hypothetical protein
MLANTQYISAAVEGLNCKFTVGEGIVIYNSLTSFNILSRL